MAGRGLSVAQINASAGAHRIVVPCVEMQFASGTLRLAIGISWDLTAGANTYIAAPLEIGPARESEQSVEGITVQMSGLDPAVIGLMVAREYQGRTLLIVKAYLHPDNNTVIEAVRRVSAYRMRNMVGEEDNSKANVAVIAEHYDAELNRAMPLRYAKADQERLFPGDLGCDMAARNSDKTVIWPSKEAQKYSGSIIDALTDTLRRRMRGGG
jgi:hypothetical protein